MATNLAQRLDAIEADIEAARKRWCSEMDFALRAAGSAYERQCFDRALARSVGDEVLEGDRVEDDRVADELCKRISPELLRRSWLLWPQEANNDST